MLNTPKYVACCCKSTYIYTSKLQKLLYAHSRYIHVNTIMWTCRHRCKRAQIQKCNEPLYRSQSIRMRRINIAPALLITSVTLLFQKSSLPLTLSRLIRRRFARTTANVFPLHNVGVSVSPYNRHAVVRAVRQLALS